MTRPLRILHRRLIAVLFVLIAVGFTLALLQRAPQLQIDAPVAETGR